jgi:hypothetical protein
LLSATFFVAERLVPAFAGMSRYALTCG